MPHLTTSDYITLAGSIATAVAAVAAVGALIYARGQINEAQKQLRQSRAIAHGDFLLRLDEAFQAGGFARAGDARQQDDALARPGGEAQQAKVAGRIAGGVEPDAFGIRYRRAAVLLDDQTHDKRRDSKLKSERPPHIVDLG